MLLQELNFHVHLFGFQGRSAKRPSSQIGVSVFNRCLYQFTTAADKQSISYVHEECLELLALANSGNLLGSIDLHDFTTAGAAQIVLREAVCQSFIAQGWARGDSAHAGHRHYMHGDTSTPVTAFLNACRDNPADAVIVGAFFDHDDNNVLDGVAVRLPWSARPEEVEAAVAGFVKQVDALATRAIAPGLDRSEAFFR